MMGFSGRLNKKLLQAQLEHPNVKYIEADQVMSINYEQEYPVEAPAATVTQTGATWGLVRVSQRNLALTPANYLYDSSAGNGADVYVIDTGILITHPDFGGRASFGYTAITGESNSDLNGHGTHCAGTVAGTAYGVAKQARLIAVKVLNGAGSGTNAGVIQGVNWVTNNKSGTRPSVASMSLGGGASTTLDQAVQNSITAGTPYSIAAGNDNANACNGSPARVTTAITVGATANTDVRSTFSSFGTCVDVFAPGTNIQSDWLNNGVNTISGTSMATPHVAGVAALYRALNPAHTATQVKAAIVGSATPNKVTNPGAGSPNLLLYNGV